MAYCVNLFSYEDSVGHSVDLFMFLDNIEFCIDRGYLKLYIHSHRAAEVSKNNAAIWSTYNLKKRTDMNSALRRAHSDQLWLKNLFFVINLWFDDYGHSTY